MPFLRVLTLVVFLLSPVSAGIVHRWSFNQPNGPVGRHTPIVDSVSGLIAYVEGNGAIVQNQTLVLPGNTTGNASPESIAAYVDLPNHLISNKKNITIEIWV